MRNVAALCVARRSVYKSMAGVECFDQERDVRTFRFDMPVVAHPPCADWSRMRAFAKVVPGRKELAEFCLEAVRRCGGVLEHPVGSLFFRRLPAVGCRDEFGFTTVVDQSWFGFAARKRTLLYVCGVDDLPVMPLSLGYALKRVDWMTGEYRSATTVEFANFLISIARSVL